MVCGNHQKMEIMTIEEVTMTTRKGLQKTGAPASIKELSQKEIAQVSGGFGPFIAALVSVAMSTTARGLATALISRGSAIYAVYSAAAHYGGGGGKKGKKSLIVSQ
jgi:lactobin A/cerein 7B family class IIb bacteriocin